MHHSSEHQGNQLIESIRSTLLLLSFGVALLALLVAIDRPQWFKLRPASGTAAAMAQAAQIPSPTNANDGTAGGTAGAAHH